MQLSLNALSRANSSRVMRMKGICGNKPLFILVNSGSTHNFLSEEIASKLGCFLKEVEGTSVRVASGVAVQCSMMCKGFECKV